MRNPAHKQLWRAEKESVPLTPVPYRDAFTPEEFRTICSGLVPRSMEEKWYVLFETPYLLFFRSWTGRLIYRMRVDQDLSGARVVDAEVLDNPEFYKRGSADFEVSMLSWLVRRLLLHQDVPLPMRAG